MRLLSNFVLSIQSTSSQYSGAGKSLLFIKTVVFLSQRSLFTGSLKASFTRSVGVLALLLFYVPLSAEANESASKLFKSKIQPFLQKYCVDCHDDETQKGGVSLHDLNSVSYDNAALWKQVWEQVSLKEMPPRKKKKQPTLLERYELSNVVTDELIRAHSAKGGFKAHLHPLKANHLDHDLLFNTTHKNLEPASSPARIWRLHPMEHLVRLNELVANEPAYDPSAPGKYTRGDSIVPTAMNELKLYFGLERYVKGVESGGYLSKLAQGFYPVMPASKGHGLRDYPLMHGINGSVSTQMLSVAEQILRFMAYGPEPIELKSSDDKTKVLIKRITYSNEIKRPLTPVYDLIKKPDISDPDLIAAINYLFKTITLREPSKKETAFYLEIAKDSVKNLGKEKGLFPGLAPIFVDHFAFFRPELTKYGTPDKYGRVMLQGEELKLAINHAFCYILPDDTLNKALAAGMLKTREDVKREVTRILNDDATRKPRILQFFREYFDYGHAADICKDSKSLSEGRVTYQGINNNKVQTHRSAMVTHVTNTDRLVELILHEDKDVFRELLTTDRAIYTEYDDLYFANTDSKKKYILPFPFYEAKKGTILYSKDGVPFKGNRKSKDETVEQYKARWNAYTDRRNELMNDAFPGKETPIHVRVPKIYHTYAASPYDRLRGRIDRLQGGHNRPRTLTRLKKSERRGILTHPSWLVSHSDAMDNHAILRGKWIRERLLGDAVPDVPITVNAMLPEEPKSTLRHRMRVTREDECWRCHRKMDPLGFPFEMYNHLGMYREKEKGKPVDTSGEIMFSGDPKLDGPVSNAIEMIDKLANSERVEQVFVRHVFRFWMGRNETLNDAPILKAAHKAYKESGGSMKALLISLLTSDAFLYRKVDRAVYSKK